MKSLTCPICNEPINVCEVYFPQHANARAMAYSLRNNETTLKVLRAARRINDSASTPTLEALDAAIDSLDTDCAQLQNDIDIEREKLSACQFSLITVYDDDGDVMAWLVWGIPPTNWKMPIDRMTVQRAAEAQEKDIPTKWHPVTLWYEVKGDTEDDRAEVLEHVEKLLAVTEEATRISDILARYNRHYDNHNYQYAVAVVGLGDANFGVLIGDVALQMCGYQWKSGGRKEDRVEELRHWFENQERKAATYEKNALEVFLAPFGDTSFLTTL